MELLKLLESLRTPFWDAVMSALSYVGGEMVFILLAITFYWCVNKDFSYYVLTVGFFGTMLNQVCKLAFAIPRPWVRDPGFTIVESARAEAAGFSFPSGHTQNVTATFGCTGLYFSKPWLRIACAAVILSVAFSRMYLGVHTPADVLAALALGLLTTLAFYPLSLYARKNPKVYLYTFWGILGASLSFLLYVALYPFAPAVQGENLDFAVKTAYMFLGAAAAICIAYPLEARYIRFNPRCVWWMQLIKIAVGFAGVLAIKEFTKAPLYALSGGEVWADAPRYFLVVLFAFVLWPWCFTRLEKRFNKPKTKDV